jgi:hypothetical protein
MKVISVLLTSSVLVLACGGSDEQPPGFGISKEVACEEFSKAACDRLKLCNPFILGTVYDDELTCVSRKKLECNAMLNAGGTSLTPNGLSACAKETAGQKCADITAGVQLPACKTVAGTVATGSACNFDAQCAGGYCRRSNGVTCGKCTARTVVGASCVRSDECEVGSRCIGQTCRTLAPAGGTCGADKPCVGSLRCIGTTCLDPIPIGGSCSKIGEDCVEGAFCNSNSTKCEAIELVLKEKPCGTVIGAIKACKAGGNCPVSSGGVGSVCFVAAADGAACDDSTNRCLSPAVCVDSKCQLPNPDTCK